MVEYGLDAKGNRIRASQVCAECWGSGKIGPPDTEWRTTCPTCNGTGKRRRERESKPRRRRERI